MPYTISIVNGRALSMEEVVDLCENEHTNKDMARQARKAIKAQIELRNLSEFPFDTGFACGLNFALGAFSGVCEEDEK